MTTCTICGRPACLETLTWPSPLDRVCLEWMGDPGQPPAPEVMAAARSIKARTNVSGATVAAGKAMGRRAGHI